MLIVLREIFRLGLGLERENKLMGFKPKVEWFSDWDEKHNSSLQLCKTLHFSSGFILVWCDTKLALHIPHTHNNFYFYCL